MPAWQPLTMQSLGIQRAFLSYDFEFKPFSMLKEGIAEGQGGEIKVFEVVEQMPEFPGGYTAMMSWLNRNIRYPSIAEKNGIQGRVVCTFVVERDGSITDIQVARSVDPSLDKEAIRVLKLMPKWSPGRQNGAPVRVKYTVPLTFSLSG
ncbi:MAG: energy transducer TonB [Prevotella sp.]|nr:energy transducer TonB [Prevotella sp.]